TADAECAFAKENRGAILPVLDHQCLWSHGEHLARGPRQAAVIRQYFGLGVIDQQNVDDLECLQQFAAGTIDPEIHGVAAGEAHLIHFQSYGALQTWIDIAQKKKFRIRVLLRNMRLELFEDVQVREIGFRFVQVIVILPAPTEGLSLGMLNATRIYTAI